MSEFPNSFTPNELINIIHLHLTHLTVFNVNSFAAIEISETGVYTDVFMGTIPVQFQFV
jgi:hypothetical protein